MKTATHWLHFIFIKVAPAALLALALGACTAKAKLDRLAKRAENDFQQGKYDAAKIGYMNVLRASPEHAAAIERIGTMWLEQGAPLRAMPFLRKALEQSPASTEVRLKLAYSYRAVRQTALAKKEVLAILAQSPTHAEALMMLSDDARTTGEIAQVEEHLQKLPSPDGTGFQLASANLAVRKGDGAAAEKALQRALVLEPKSPTAHLAMGNFLLLQKKEAQAGAEFKAAAELSPIRSTMRLRYAEFKIKTGAVKDARAVLEEITAKAPDCLPAWLLLAQMAYAEMKYADAQALLVPLLNRDGDNLDALMLQNQIWLAEREVKKAVAGLEKVNVVYAGNPVLKYDLARAQVQDNNLNAAAAALSQALDIQPEFAEATLLLGEINLRLNNAAAVVPAMRGLLSKHPESRDAQRLLAEACLALGRPEEAAEIFRQQIAADAQRWEPHFHLGLVLSRQEKLAEARAAFENAQERAPENLLPATQLVKLDLAQRNFAAATEKVARQLQKSPSSPAVHLLKAKVHGAQAEWDLAEAAVLKALDLDPDSSEAYDQLTATYVAANRLPQALSQVEILLAKEPKNFTALVVAAMLYDTTGAFSKARDAYEKILEVRPEFIPALNNLAYLYAERLNQPDRAFELARKGRTLQPENPAMADTLGWILHRRGDYPQALALLTESAGKLPANAEIQFHLGMASYMMGQPAAARTALEKAAQAPGEFPGKAEIPRRLALLSEGAGGKKLAAEEIEALLKQQPDDLIALLKLGETYEQEAAFAKAATAYEKALRLNPKLPATHVKLAQLYAGPLANREKALDFARKARELAPTDPQVAGILGGIAVQTGNFAWAHSLLDDSSRRLPNDPATLRNLGWAAYGLGKTAEARQAMQQVLAATPTGAQAEDAQTFLTLTAPDPSAGHLAAAESAIEKALTADPMYLPALMARAAAQTQRGETQPAAATYSGILDRLPDFPLAQKQLAAIWASSPGNIAKAYELAIKARKTLPADPELGLILAEISYQKKEFTAAIRLFNESARIKPLGPKSLYYFGLSQLQNLQKPQGCDLLHRALQAGLKEPFATDAKRALAEEGQLR